MIRISIAEAGKSPQLLTFNADSVTLGRASSHELCLTGKGVSGTHCRLIREGPAYFVEDLGSTNGTYVNRQRVQGRQPIGPRDDVVLAVYQLRVLADSESGVSAYPVAGPSDAPQFNASGDGYAVATPGVRGHAPTAHVPAPGAVGSMPSVHPPSMQSMPSVHPPSMQSVPPAAVPSMPSGHPSSMPSVPPASMQSVPPAPMPSMQSVPPASMPSMPPSQTSGAPPGSNLSTSGRNSSGAGVRPGNLAWEREWEQIDKLANAWLAAGKSGGALLRGDKLAHARKWFAQGRAKRPAPTALHRDFIAAGSRRRGLRIFGNLTMGTVLLGGIAGGGYWLYDNQIVGAATDDDDVALVGADVGGDGPAPIDPLEKGNRAASDALAAKAEAKLDKDPVLAALLATEAVAMLPRDRTAIDSDAYIVFRKAMRALPGRPLREHTGSIAAVALSPDGRWAVTSEGGRSRNVRLWDLN
ncbi:MAG: FHA domain-containing protein, partial [Deltaproteobacteria bacterium]|nr:FHA domain-containing protein [Deltaproteobacteria bacterium]